MHGGLVLCVSAASNNCNCAYILPDIFYTRSRRMLEVVNIALHLSDNTLLFYLAFEACCRGLGC